MKNYFIPEEEREFILKELRRETVKICNIVETYEMTLKEDIPYKEYNLKNFKYEKYSNYKYEFYCTIVYNEEDKDNFPISCSIFIKTNDNKYYGLLSGIETSISFDKNFDEQVIEIIDSINIPNSIDLHS